MLSVMVHEGLWSEKEEDTLMNVLPKHIEEWKVQLYQAAFKSETRNKLRKYLAAAQEEEAKLNAKRSKYHDYTQEGYASFAKNMVVIKHSCVTDTGEELDWSNISVSSLLHAINVQQLGAQQIRCLARTSPWTSEWAAAKHAGKIFNNDVLTSEQQFLISWSITYDNIAQSMDCPTDEVINDDDMLDGWLILKRRQSEGQKIKDRAGGFANSSKINNANEIFLAVDNQHDAQMVETLNPPQISAIKRRRLREVEEAGTIQDHHLSDIKRDVIMQANAAFGNKVRNQ